MGTDQTIELPRTLVLIGLMGAGKTAIGRRLAARLHLDFVDADHEIERAAGCTVEDIFTAWGEPAFRDCERRVISRLIDGPVHVLSTGGGAFMNGEIREMIARKGISLWLRADVDVLLARTSRRSNRPLLKQGDPRQILEQLVTIRHPVYAQADIVVDSTDSPPEETTRQAMDALAAFLSAPAEAPQSPPLAPPGRSV